MDLNDIMIKHQMKMDEDKKKLDEIIRKVMKRKNKMHFLIKI